MKKPTKSEETRDKLIDAAYEEVYRHGYHGAATAAILKNAGVPKGSMYHFFPSKKALVLAVICERIFPRMERFFNFTPKADTSAYDTLAETFAQMRELTPLITYGCPLHRLMVEMASLDSEFDAVLSRRYERFVGALNAMLRHAVEIGEFEPFDTEAFARFVINATWGALSISPSLSSPEAFSAHTALLLELLRTKQKAG